MRNRICIMVLLIQGCSYSYYPNVEIQQTEQNANYSEGCIVKLYIGSDLPTDRYEILGTCVGRGTSRKSMDNLEKCACKKGGDAVIFNAAQTKVYTNQYQYQYHQQSQGRTSSVGTVIKFMN